MVQEEIEKRDIAFFKAFVKDRTLNRAEFNAQWAKDNKKEKPIYKCGFKSISPPSPEHKIIYNALSGYCKDFPNISNANIIFSGATGTGKTFMTNIISDNLKNSGFKVEYTTAFGMVKAFQNYIQTFGRDSSQIDNFLECDLLIIDDLGTEPIIKNITQEHIYNIVNERLVNERPFIITTNLDPDAIKEKYDQRIASRILSKETSRVIEVKCKDLRINKGNSNK